MIIALRPLDLISDHCFILLAALGHLLCQEVVRHIRSVSNEDELPLALTLLVSCRSKSSTDPRDKVYGLYGLMGRDSRCNVVVNYNNSVEKVYIDIARIILSESRSPNILLFAASFPPDARTMTTSKLDLPSWVPDWSLRDFDAYLKEHSYHRYLVLQSAWAIYDIKNPQFSASGNSAMATIQFTLDEKQSRFWASEESSVAMRVLNERVPWIRNQILPVSLKHRQTHWRTSTAGGTSRLPHFDTVLRPERQLMIIPIWT